MIIWKKHSIIYKADKNEKPPNKLVARLKEFVIFVSKQAVIQILKKLLEKYTKI